MTPFGPRRMLGLGLSVVLSALPTPGSTWAQEGLFVDGRHQQAKAVVQRHDYPTNELDQAIKTLRAMIGEVERKGGKDSLAVGALLLDIGEAATVRASGTQGAARDEGLRRGIRAMEEGERLVAPAEARYEAATVARARAHLKMGLAHKALGDRASAESKFRAGLAIHAARYGDHAYQLPFFEPLDAVTPPGDKKVRTARIWLKLARAFGHPYSDVAIAEQRLAAAQDMVPALIESLDRARAEAEALARAGDAKGAYRRLEGAFAAVRGEGARRVFVARTKPSPFLIYKDPRAAGWQDWDVARKPLSEYDVVSTRFFVEHGLMPFIEEGRNNLLALLTGLQATYRTGDRAAARDLCRLVPPGYNGYANRLPQVCSNAVGWAGWSLSMGDFDQALSLLAMAADLEGERAARSRNSTDAARAARREVALMHARYGSPDSFLAALDASEREEAPTKDRAFEKDPGTVPSLPSALLFYAGVLRDDPIEVEAALRAAGRFDLVDEDEMKGRSAESDNPYVGEHLRERLDITGERVAAFLCQAKIEGLPALVRMMQCRKAGQDMILAADEAGRDNSVLTAASLLTAASPELRQIVRDLPGRAVAAPLTDALVNPVSARLLDPTSAESRATARVVANNFSEDDARRAGIDDSDIEKGAVAQAFAEKGRLALARSWAGAAYTSYQIANGGATIWSAWLIESFRETRYREGWVWLAAGMPILAEAAFDDFVPHEVSAETGGAQAQTQEFDWSRTLGGLHGRMLAREALAELRGARADARSFVSYVGRALARQSFTRFETRDLVVRSAQPGLRDAIRLLFGTHESLDRATEPEAFDAAFTALQFLKRSTTATTVTRLAARLSATTSQLAEIVRQREALRRVWDEQRVSALRGSSPEKIAEVRRLGDALTALDTRIAREFPAYLDLSTLVGVSVEDVRAALGTERVLIVTSTVSEDVYIATISASAAGIRRNTGSSASLRSDAVAVRRSLEPRSERFLLYRRTEGERLFRLILAPVWDLVAAPGRTTLVQVSDGALENLPFSVLPHGPGDDFVIDAMAVSRMPSVASLVSLHRATLNKASTGTPTRKPFLGIGDPVLEGLPNGKGGLEAREVFTGAGRIDMTHLRSLPRLPETADEIRRLSVLLGATEDAMLLGEDATETSLRGLVLTDYRIIAFATHGIVAGRYSRFSEPGLVLTPPREASGSDDGYLAASEISTLTLSAEMVLLSACNTAAPGGVETEGLSGLSKSFFFAGARSLLVSHWSLRSDAAAALTTALIGARRSGGDMSYAQALRAAILELRREATSDTMRHPGFWGAFDVIGG